MIIAEDYVLVTDPNVRADHPLFAEAWRVMFQQIKDSGKLAEAECLRFHWSLENNLVREPQD